MFSIAIAMPLILAPMQQAPWGPDEILSGSGIPSEVGITAFGDQVVVIESTPALGTLNTTVGNSHPVQRNWQSYYNIFPSTEGQAKDLTVMLEIFPVVRIVLCWIWPGLTSGYTPSVGPTNKKVEYKRDDLWFSPTPDGGTWCPPERAIDPFTGILNSSFSQGPGVPSSELPKFNRIVDYEITLRNDTLVGFAVAQAEDGKHILFIFDVPLPGSTSPATATLVDDDVVIDKNEIALLAAGGAVDVFWTERFSSGVEELFHKRMRPGPQTSFCIGGALTIDQIRVTGNGSLDFLSWREDGKLRGAFRHNGVTAFEAAFDLVSAPDVVHQELALHGSSVFAVYSTASGEVFVQRSVGGVWDPEFQLFSSASKPTITAGNGTVLVTAQRQDGVWGRLWDTNQSVWGTEFSLSGTLVGQPEATAVAFSALNASYSMVMSYSNGTYVSGFFE